MRSAQLLVICVEGKTSKSDQEEFGREVGVVSIVDGEVWRMGGSEGR